MKSVVHERKKNYFSFLLQYLILALFVEMFDTFIHQFIKILY